VRQRNARAHSHLADELAAGAEHVKRHLEADDQDALVQLLGALAQRVLRAQLQARQALVSLFTLLESLAERGRALRSRRAACTRLRTL